MKKFSGSRWSFLLLTASLLAPVVQLARADALQPAFALEGPGFSIAEAGVGAGGDAARRTLPQVITIQIDGPVEKAMLYWGGFMNRVVPPQDGVLRFHGSLVAGAVVGTETVGNASDLDLVFARGVDVTEIVKAAYDGPHAYNFVLDDDGNALNNADRLHGAGLFVVYADPAVTQTFQILASHGCDYAFNRPDFLPENLVTTPVTFNYGAEMAARGGDLVIFGGGGQADRPEQITITDNPTVENSFDGTDGIQWDTDRFGVGIPAASLATTIQGISSSATKVSPDSFFLVLGALRVPVAGDDENPDENPDEQMDEDPDGNPDEDPDGDPDEGSDGDPDEDSDGGSDEGSDGGKVVTDKKDSKKKGGGWVNW